MSDCLFCKIISGQIPCAKVYEDDHVLAFLDINPVNPGHLLLVTKEHWADTASTPDHLLSALAVAAKKVGQALFQGLDYPAFNLIANNGPEAGQIIMHTHWHLIPRKADDGLHLWPGKPYASEESAANIAETIKSLI